MDGKITCGNLGQFSLDIYRLDEHSKWLNDVEFSTGKDGVDSVNFRINIREISKMQGKPVVLRAHVYNLTMNLEDHKIPVFAKFSQGGISLQPVDRLYRDRTVEPDQSVKIDDSLATGAPEQYDFIINFG